MDYSGTVHGNRIDLDDELPLSDGTRVRVNVHPENGTGRGSPSALLKLVGTLTEQEADAISQATKEARKIDRSLWQERP